MEIALSFGVIPFLTGRTLLTVGLLVTYYSLRLALAEGALTPRTVLQGAVGAAMAVMAQALAQWAREAVRELTETVRSLERRLNAMAMSVVAMLFALFILGRFGHQLAASGAQVGTAGIDVTLVVVLGVGAVAFWFATLRGRVADVLEKLPLLDQVGVRRVAFVAEATWTFVGLVLVIAFPLVGATLAALALLSLVALAGWVRRLARGARGPCATCGEDLHLSALRCPACGAERTPQKLGLWGGAVDGAPREPAAHRFALLCARRCPSCAERLTVKNGVVRCEGCGAPAFTDAEQARRFVGQVDARVLALGPVFAGLGLLPVLGLGLALLLYRVAPSGALAGMVRPKDRLVTRLLKGLAVVLLALVQPVPLLGVAAVVGLLAAQHLWTRRAFLGAST
jgi:hypothetical protein